MAVRIDSYLTQSKLADAIQGIVGASRWIGAEVLVAEGARYRWDAVFVDQRGERVAVEYDGDAHYRDPMKVKRDVLKDSLARDRETRVVRVPYWVQLTSETARYYFDWNVEVVQDFPHGFITTKFFPSAFCELGLTRFRGEMLRLPQQVRDAVIASLNDRAAEYGREYVIPSSLQDLVP